MRNRGLSVTASVLKMLVGVIFIISAVSKFITIDVFEVYVYSFGLVPLTVSFYVSRLVIAFELILAASLISNRHHRFTSLMTLLFLLCFTVFLAYAHLTGRSDSCHCFGDLMPLDPVQSMLKNAVLIAMVLFAYKCAVTEWTPRWWLVIPIYVATAAAMFFYMTRELHTYDILALVLMLVTMCVGVLASFKFYSRWYVTAVLVLTPLVTVFILTPPDSWFYRGTHERFDQELFQESLDADGTELAGQKLREGRRVVAFVSPTCGYCQLAAGKLTTIVERGKLDGRQILYVFPQVKKTESYDKFFEKSRSARFESIYIDKELFIKITRGSFPIIMLMDGGEVTASFAYRNINEKIVSAFLMGESE